MMSYGIYLGGRWLETNDRLQVTNPYNGEQVGETSIASKEEMDIAAERAQDAFEIMKRMSAGERSAILKSMADGIRDRFEEFANVIAIESAKAINAAKTEVLRAINTLELASEEARRIGGDVIPMDMLPAARYKFGISRRFPVGVILGITPFNYPLNLPCHKIGPALAMGNSIIIKPASATPLSMMLLAEIAEKTDLPKGAFIVLPCRGSDTEHLISSPYVKKISFTGSADTGWRIKEIAARKKVTLELGGNAALVIHSDSDIAEAAKKAITGGFVYNGQVCISVQRVLVHRPVYEKTLESMVKETKGLKAGNQTDERHFITAMITPHDADRVMGWIAEAVGEGAEAVTGNKRDGSIVFPTILTKTKPEMKVNCMEVFGPVITIEPYDEFEEAVAMVNRSRYGLQAGYFTKDITRIAYAYNETDTGGVIINDYPTFRLDHMPYGGVKDSGTGREGVRYAMEEMSELRLLVIDTSPGKETK